MQWTLEAFFATGGTTNFVDRLTAALGIHASNVKVVSVFTGSVIVNFDIVNNATSNLNLAAIQAKLTMLIQKDQIDFGAPILDASIKGIAIKTDPAKNDGNGGNNGGDINNGGGKIIIEEEEEQKN